MRRGVKLSPHANPRVMSIGQNYGGGHSNDKVEEQTNPLHMLSKKAEKDAEKR